MSNIIDKIRISGVTYTLQGSGGGGGTVDSAITSASTDAVESKAIYNATHVEQVDLWTATDSSSYIDTSQSLYKVYVQYTGDTALDEQVQVEIYYGSSSTRETLSGNVYQETATTSSVFTSTFDNGKWIIESLSPNYIVNIHSDYRFRIWTYDRTVGGDFAADVIKDDIIPYIGDVDDKAQKSVVGGNFGSTDNDRQVLMYFDMNNGKSFNTYMELNDLKYTSGVLSTDIQIPTGEVGWTEITPQNNCTAGNMPTNKVKVTYSGQTVSASSRGLRFDAVLRYSNGYRYYTATIYWSDTTTLLVDGCSAVTATYDSTDDSVTIELPTGETTYDGLTGTFSISNFRSNGCQFGRGISSVKYYGDITEDIYTSMAHKQNTLSAGTGIEISGNVISATGGTVDTALDSGSTNPVQNQALYDELRITETEPDTVIVWSDGQSTNFPSGCTKIEVDATNIPDNFNRNVNFLGAGGLHDFLGDYEFENFSRSVRVTNGLDGSTYSVSGYVVTIEWNASVGVNSLMCPDTDGITVTAIGSNTTISLKQALSGKVDTSSVVSSVTSASTDSEIPTAKAVWEAASGGGTTYTAGRGIDITSDTISVSLPISAGTGTNSIAEGSGTEASGNYSHAEGDGAKAQGNSSHAEGQSTRASGNRSHAEGQSTKATGVHSHAEGNGTQANGSSSHAEGRNTIANNNSEHASGQYNVSSSASTEFGDSGNTLFSVGNGTSNSSRHNAFEIRQNGDIYLSSGGTDIKLQDHLGGGGSSINVVQTTGSSTADVMSQSAVTTQLNNKADSTAAVGGYQFGATSNVGNIKFKAVGSGYIGSTIYYPNINGKGILTNNLTWAKNNYNFQLVETSAITTSITSSSTNDEIPSAKAVNDKLGGLSLVKLTQSEYDDLATKDDNTLYVIVN